MSLTQKSITLKPGTIRAFAGVRGRVKAAVAAQPRSVSLSDALSQTRRFQKSDGTKK